jgi:type IV pilus assembly protein PilQ
MRKQLLGVMVPLLAFVLIAAAADMPGTGTATTSALQRLEVTRGDDGLRVQFIAKGALSPKVTTLDSPSRIVVDLPNTAMATAMGRISVGSDGVKAVRVGTNGKTPPSTRVVVDLAAACRHELVTGQDGSVVLKIDEAKTGEAVARHAKPAPVATAAKLVEVSAPAAPAAQKSTQPMEVATIAPPAKDDKASQSVEPVVKAQEAASRFADKTAAELVAMNAHATVSQDAAPSTSTAIQPAVNMAAEQKAQIAHASATSGTKYTGEPISVNLKDVDLKDFFRLIHEISGLNVVLDPNVHGTLTIVLDDVPWDQALDIVLKNNDLSRQLEGNILRIATVETLKREAENRRAQIDAEALAVDKVTITRFLSYAHAKDVLLTLKKFISQRGDIVADDRTNSIIISDIPASLPQIDRIIQQLDRKTQEVEIEARVVAATRAFARDIGTQFGFGWGNGTTTVGGAPATGGSPLGAFGGNPLYTILGTAPPAAGTFNQIPLFSNLPATGPTSGLAIQNTSNNVRIDAILTMAEARGLLKILSRPRVVTQNNIQAIVRQGVKVPVVTAAQLNGPPTVTYVDAFLRLTVTPQITSEGTIFLNVDVENTVPDFGNAVNGNPTLVTQQATTQVLVTDGGTVVIGGVIQSNNSLAIDQVPLLGSIPYLGNLFKHRAVKTSDQELIFFITPRIVQT